MIRTLFASLLFTIAGSAQAQGVQALVLEETAPWGGSPTQELSAQGVAFTVVDSATFATTQLDQYTMMFVTSCQSDGVYNAFNARAAEVDTWVSDGGFLAIHGCVFSCGNASGATFPQPPGGNVSWQSDFPGSGLVIDPADPLMASLPANPTGTSLAHTGFSATGGGGDINLIEANGLVSYFRRVHGNGNVAVGGLTYEFGWINGQDAGTVLVNEVTWGQTVGSQCDPTGPDSDGDGVSDDCDKCAGFDDALDADGDFVPDGCDVCAGFNDFQNPDDDLFPSGCDNCPQDPNDDQIDSDGDGSGDPCDPCPGFDDAIDGDYDGAPDQCDNCPTDENPGQSDGDGDGIGDICDICPADNPDDTDGDGFCDSDDRCPGFDDTIDGDGDGRPDGCDNCPFVNNGNQADADGDGSGNFCDCQPENAQIFPGGTEVCDGEDNDCNGIIDDVEVLNKYYADADLDGYGDPNDVIESCELPDGYVEIAGDCDDTDPAVHEGVQEVEDEIDNNCDGKIDEGFKSATDGGGGCGCSGTGSAPGGAGLVGLLGLLALRRRRD